ncbi:hypothetical protein EVAR_74330_1 [Eumeta japonica]|uniref:Uncharacterized protein n=1 Tax=Eumeta variegata TaxID=151549 RepID=A0A4C1SD71_EUMVA|nr:hypothetical protein EVAR_74330_1 [Eumeta japonica]
MWLTNRFTFPLADEAGDTPGCSPPPTTLPRPQTSPSVLVPDDSGPEILQRDLYLSVVAGQNNKAIVVP